jgi:hypothetical protein
LKTEAKIIKKRKPAKTLMFAHLLVFVVLAAFLAIPF